MSAEEWAYDQGYDPEDLATWETVCEAFEAGQEAGPDDDTGEPHPPR